MPVRLQSGATANKFRCATRSPYFMIPNPASRLSSRATSTLIAGSSMFAVTRCSVQRQFKPFSIKSRDILAMALASVACARLKQSSDLVFILLADAKKRGWDIEPLGGEDLEKIAKEIMVQPAEVIERVKKMLAS